uniref:Glyco_hydro_18 domain-containing protein n=1 Tax=Caenorhabditis tropicalis TaxID=1561998 RepID=A0A1I7UCG2_9PELO
MPSRRDENTPLRNTSSIREDTSCQKFIKPYRSLLILFLIIVGWIPPAFVLSEAIMYCCADILTNRVPKTDIPFLDNTKLVDPSRSLSVPAEKCGKRIINYHRDIFEPVKEMKIRNLTHLIFAFISMSSNGDIGFYSDEHEEKFSDLKRRARMVNTGMKVMAAIGGAGRSNHFENVIGNIETRRHFIDSIAFFF